MNQWAEVGGGCQGSDRGSGLQESRAGLEQPLKPRVRASSHRPWRILLKSWPRPSQAQEHEDSSVTSGDWSVKALTQCLAHRDTEGHQKLLLLISPWVTLEKIQLKKIFILKSFQTLKICKIMRKFLFAFHPQLPGFLHHTSCALLFIFIVLSVSVYIIFYHMFQNKLRYIDSFTSKYFSLYFLKTRACSYITIEQFLKSEN